MENKLDRIVAELDRSLVANHLNDRELFESLNKAQQEFGIVVGDRPYSPFLRPQFFTRAKYNEIKHAAEVLADAFEVMTQAALVDEEVMTELALTETEERYARIDPGYRGVCNSSRLDAFIAGDSFKFLEYNGETPAGISDQMQIEKVLSNVPEIGEFLKKHEHWTPKSSTRKMVPSYSSSPGSAIRQRWPCDSKYSRSTSNFAIVDWTGVSTFTEFEVLREYFESQGHRCLIADPGELEYDGTILRVEDFDVDIFYKRVLIHELFERSDDDHPILQAYRDGNVCMANSFRTKIPHKKASLAVLHTERFDRLFTGEHREMIDKHLPWTRRISDRKTRYDGESVDLLEFTRSERNKLILKPNDDYGGSGIVVGWESSESEWDAAIENALEVPFVVQERADVEKVRFPSYGTEASLVELLIDFDPFIFRGKVEGGLVRLSNQSLVNVAAGGGEAAMVVLEEV